MGVRITLDELIDGATNIVKDCVKHRASPMSMFEISNGEKTAQIDAVFFKTNPIIYWDIKSSRLKLNNTDTAVFIDAYNKKAKSLGITGFHVTLEHITICCIISMIILDY
jgi:hypothetical protein